MTRGKGVPFPHVTECESPINRRLMGYSNNRAEQYWKTPYYFWGNGDFSGTLAVAGDASTIFVSGSYSFNDGSQITGDGFTFLTRQNPMTSMSVAGQVSVNNFAMTGGYLSGSGTLTIQQSMWWLGGAMEGNGTTRIAENAELHITGLRSGENPSLMQGYTTIGGQYRLENAGAALWDGAPFEVFLGHEVPQGWWSPG